MKKLLLLIVCIETFFQVSGQIIFERRDSVDIWPGFSSGTSNSILETPDHGFLSAGTGAAGLINVYYWEKIDSTGHQLWGHTYAFGASDAYIFSAGLTTDSGFIISGRCSSCGLMGIIKTDFNGSIVWDKIIGNQTTDAYGSSAIQTKDGGYIIAGAMYNSISGALEASLIKLDGSGNNQWSKSYGVWQRFNDIVLLDDSGFIAVGSANSSEQIFIVRTNSVGDTLWTKRYQKGFTSIEGKSITKTFNDCFIISGYSSGAQIFGSVLVKINSGGDTLWTKNLGYLDTLAIKSVEETSDSGLILSATKGYYKCLMIKTDSTGGVQWVKKISDMYYCGCAIQTNDNGYAIAGAPYFSVVKTNGLGNTNCTSLSSSINISMNGLDQMFDTLSIRNNTLPNTTSTGFYSLLNLDDVMTCNPLTINNLDTDKSFLNIAPNPAVNFIIITSPAEITQVEIYSTLGDRLTIINARNQQEIEINLEDLIPAMYFLKIFSKEKVITQKIIKN